MGKLRRILRNIALSIPSRRWLWASAVATCLIGIAGIAIWIGWPRDDVLEDLCSPPVSNVQQIGCVATVPIKDVDVRVSSTIGLSRDGTKLLVGGPLPHDKTKQVLQAVDVAERRVVWRVPFNGLGFYPQLAVSGDDSKIAAWASEPRIRIVDMQNGKTIIELPNENPHTDPVFDASFSEDGKTIVTGSAYERRVLSLSDPTAKPTIAPGFGSAEGGCRAGGMVGQSNLGSVRSRDGSTAVLSPADTASPVRTGKLGLSRKLAEAICGTQSVLILDAPADWRYAEAMFLSFSPDNGRLAVVYADMQLGRETRTLIEVWDMSKEMYPDRLAAFSVSGDVGYRIAWSVDGRRLAAIRSDRQNKTEARIYLIQ
jgi:WD40 repeat protein